MIVTWLSSVHIKGESPTVILMVKRTNNIGCERYTFTELTFLSILPHLCKGNVHLHLLSSIMKYTAIRLQIYQKRSTCSFKSAQNAIWGREWCSHYSDATMGSMASQVVGLTIVYSFVYSGTDSKKILKLRVTALCEGNSPVIREFPAQRASKAENVSIWWRRHDSGENGVPLTSAISSIKLNMKIRLFKGLLWTTCNSLQS